MQDKIGVVGEGFPTLAALVRPLATVDPLVLGEVRLAVEGLPTFQALEGPLFLCGSSGAGGDECFLWRSPHTLYTHRASLQSGSFHGQPGDVSY